MREIIYQIAHPARGRKISGFLKEKGYSEQNLVNLKKDCESITVNGVFARQNSVLAHGDTLVVRIREQDASDQILPAELPLDIVYEDEDLLVINKPAGMPIHPSRNNFDNSLGNALAWRYKMRGEPFVFRCINRLDRDTSGLTIVAKHMVSAAILGRMVAEKGSADRQKDALCAGIVREYVAVVEGTPCPRTGTICAPIARKESRHLERVVDFTRGDRAVTHYEVLEECTDRSVVRLTLETGRTHQIRVHMSYLGHPLFGDFLYNPGYAANLIGRQALHAHRLSFRQPMTGEPLEFIAPAPEDIKRCIEEGRRKNAEASAATHNYIEFY